MTKSLSRIDEQMSALEPDSLRYQVLEQAKNFKVSWIELGRFLYTIYNDKHYRTWGFREFETYCVKEIGIKVLTAQKLLRSYHFLEKEEPAYVAREKYQGEDAPRVPDYESVNVLRQAKNRKLEEEDYSALKKKVLDEGSPVQAVRKQYREVLEARETETESPEELREKRRQSSLKRYLTTLKSLHLELSANNFLTKKKLLEIEKFIKELEEEFALSS